MLTEILTIGYQGATIEGLFDTLRAAGAQVVVDVRAVPWSRRPAFTKHALTRAAKTAGIAYVHVPGLGNPAKAEPAGNLSLAKHLESLSGRAALDTAAALLRDHGRVALLCLERDPAACHRTEVAAALSARTGAPVRPLTIPLDPRQGDLFENG